MVANDPTLMRLMQAIVTGDAAVMSQLLAATPTVANAQLQQGATRQQANDYYLEEIERYVYAGDTATHVAAAAYREDFVRYLVAAGAEVDCRNRRGAAPLHYACDGGPGAANWNPTAQAATVTCLIEAGADPNAFDASGVAPIHRAVRTRCAAAVSALLNGGADPRRANRTGSTPMKLATQNTGRGGTGSSESKAQQDEILRLLDQFGVAR